MSLVCSSCGCSIEAKDNLVVALEFFTVTPYCSSCWAKAQKSALEQAVVGMPLNGSHANLISALFAILFPFLLYYKEYGYSALCIVLLLLRFISFWFYDRKLK